MVETILLVLLVSVVKIPQMVDQDKPIFPRDVVQQLPPPFHRRLNADDLAELRRIEQAEHLRERRRERAARTQMLRDYRIQRAQKIHQARHRRMASRPRLVFPPPGWANAVLRSHQSNVSKVYGR